MKILVLFGAPGWWWGPWAPGGFISKVPGGMSKRDACSCGRPEPFCRQSSLCRITSSSVPRETWEPVPVAAGLNCFLWPPAPIAGEDGLVKPEKPMARTAQTPGRGLKTKLFFTLTTKHVNLAFIFKDFMSMEHCGVTRKFTIKPVIQALLGAFFVMTAMVFLCGFLPDTVFGQNSLSNTAATGVTGTAKPVPKPASGNKAPATSPAKTASPAAASEETLPAAPTEGLVIKEIAAKGNKNV